jgi:hypothetical protein
MALHTVKYNRIKCYLGSEYLKVHLFSPERAQQVGQVTSIFYSKLNNSFRLIWGALNENLSGAQEEKSLGARKMITCL